MDLPSSASTPTANAMSVAVGTAQPACKAGASNPGESPPAGTRTPPRAAASGAPRHAGPLVRHDASRVGFESDDEKKIVISPSLMTKNADSGLSRKVPTCTAIGASQSWWSSGRTVNGPGQRDGRSDDERYTAGCFNMQESLECVEIDRAPPSAVGAACDGCRSMRLAPRLAARPTYCLSDCWAQR